MYPCTRVPVYQVHYEQPVLEGVATALMLGYPRCPACVCAQSHLAVDGCAANTTALSFATAIFNSDAADTSSATAATSDTSKVSESAAAVAAATAAAAAADNAVSAVSAVR